MNGILNGVTQVAQRSAGPDPVLAFNFPLDVTLRATNVFGWPQLVVSMYGINLRGHFVVRGYGSTHVPTQPGRHVRVARVHQTARPTDTPERLKP